LPGLFGVVCVDPRLRLDPAAADRALDAMAGTLRHDAGLAGDRWIDPAGRFALGRIGLPSLLPPPVRGADGEPRAWLEGVAHQPAALAALAQGAPDDAALRALHGFWALAHHDPATHRLTLAVDRRASVPLVHAEAEGVLLFAPEPKALLAFRALAREPDPAGAAALLVSGYLPAERTLARGVARLAGGTALEVAPGRVTRRTWWRFAPGSAPTRAGADALARDLSRMIAAAVRRNLGDPERTVVFLSGGADSRAVLAAALDALGDPRAVRAVSWGRADAVPGSDVDLARRIAAAAGIRHEVVARGFDGYAEGFRATNRVVDGLSDVAAFHPQELSLMRSLAARGFTRALRGDEAFGWSVAVHSHEGAAVEVGLRRLGDVAAAAALVRDERRAAWLDAAAAEWRRLLDGVARETPNGAKDRLYFGERLQGMLGPAAYYKQVALDHRNPLLDEPILDALAAVPDAWRVHKRLYLRAASALPGGLFRAFPLATRSSLEDWSGLLGRPGPVSAFVASQLADAASPVWEHLDRAALQALATRAAAAGGAVAPAPGAGLRPWLRRWAYAALPRFAAEIHARRARAHVSPTELLMRALVLKDWLDGLSDRPPAVTAAPVRAAGD